MTKPAIFFAFAPVAHNGVFSWIIVGLIAGLVVVIVRSGLLAAVFDIVIGVVGAVIGALILHALRRGMPPPFWQDAIAASLGAILLLWILEFSAARRR